MGAFVFVVTMCLTGSTQLITEVVQANTEAGAMSEAQRAHPGYLVIGTPRRLG